jgi:probable HAF family extracellular repeat protein
VVGWTDTVFGTRPFFWSPDHGMVLLSADANGEGLDINRDGLAAGWRNVSIGGGVIAPRPRMWQVINGLPQATVLALLPGNDRGRANGINRYGQIVGRSYGGTAGSRAALWENGVLSDLNDLLPPGSGWVLEDAAAINDAGEIVGSGMLDGAPAAFVLSPALLPVVNDDCADAIVIDGNDFHPPLMNTAYATTEPGEAATPCGAAGVSHSVWFEFTPERSGLVAIDTQGSDYDTVLAVYDSVCAAGPAIACNNNAGPGLVHSRIDNVYLAAGVPYLVRVSGNGGGPGGMLDFNFSFAPSAALPPGRWTVISHGAWGDDLGAYPGGNPWLFDLARDLDDFDPGSVRVHTMDRDTFAMLDADGNPAAPQDVADPGVHHVLLWDWSVNSFFIFGTDSYHNDGYAYAAGDALHAFLRFHGIHDRADYFIGHSRGAVVVSETARRMIVDGIDPVQVIYLDGEGGDFVSAAYEDDRFDGWAAGGAAPVRYDSIDSTTFEGDCYYGFNLGGPECGAAGCGSRLNTYDLGTAYRHGHCEGWDGAPPPIWEYLIEGPSTARDGSGLVFDGQRFAVRDLPTATPTLPPVAASDWEGHPADRTLFNGDFEWGSVAGWLSHGGGGHGHVDSAFESSSHLELDDGAGDAWRDHAFFWLRQEWEALRFRYRVSDQDCNDAFQVTLRRCDAGDCAGGQDQTWFVTDRCAETGWRLFTAVVPDGHRGSLCRLRFWKDPGPDGDIDSQVRIDDVRFLASPTSTATAPWGRPTARGSSTPGARAGPAGRAAPTSMAIARSASAISCFSWKAGTPDGAARQGSSRARGGCAGASGPAGPRRSRRRARSFAALTVCSCPGPSAASRTRCASTSAASASSSRWRATRHVAYFARKVPVIQWPGGIDRRARSTADASSGSASPRRSMAM